MSSHIVRLVSGVALHFPQRFAIVSNAASVGELGRTQTEEKAQRLCQALELLERYERGELVERDPAGLPLVSV